MKIFISHSFQDASAFDDLCHAFENAGIAFFKPQEMRGGASLRDQLRDAINNCALCVFLATRNSVESKWCNAEVAAFWGSGKKVILLLHDEALNENDLPRELLGDIWYRKIRDVVEEAKRTLEGGAAEPKLAMFCGDFHLHHLSSTGSDEVIESRMSVGPGCPEGLLVNLEAANVKGLRLHYRGSMTRRKNLLYVHLEATHEEEALLVFEQPIDSKITELIGVVAAHDMEYRPYAGTVLLARERLPPGRVRERLKDLPTIAIRSN